MPRPARILYYPETKMCKMSCGELDKMSLQRKNLPAHDVSRVAILMTCDVKNGRLRMGILGGCWWLLNRTLENRDIFDVMEDHV